MNPYAPLYQEPNRVISADGTARIKLAASGYEMMEEFATDYAKKATKIYSDMFAAQLNDGILDGVIKFKCTDIINLCRKAGLDDEDIREACADLIWPVCNYSKFPDIYAECINDIDGPLFENVCDDFCYPDDEPPVNQYTAGKVDCAISIARDNGYSPVEAEAFSMAESGCDNHNYILNRVKQIYGLD